VVDDDVLFHYFRVRGADLINSGRIACDKGENLEA